MDGVYSFWPVVTVRFSVQHRVPVVDVASLLPYLSLPLVLLVADPVQHVILPHVHILPIAHGDGGVVLQESRER